MRLVATHPTWALGFEDEVWWSRLAQPALHPWAAPDQPCSPNSTNETTRGSLA